MSYRELASAARRALRKLRQAAHKAREHVRDYTSCASGEDFDEAMADLAEIDAALDKAGRVLGEES